MSTKRVSQSDGWVDPKNLPKGPNGRTLCRQCGKEVTEKRRRTFCSEACVDAYLIKRDPGHIRRLAFRRDAGVCALCGFDTQQIKREIRAAGSWQEEKTILQRHGVPTHRTTFWDADHIVPVIEGGGECDLDNIRTLCIPCHQRVTAELAARRAEPRRAQRLAAKQAERQGRRSTRPEQQELEFGDAA